MRTRKRNVNIVVVVIALRLALASLGDIGLGCTYLLVIPLALPLASHKVLREVKKRLRQGMKHIQYLGVRVLYKL